MIGYIINSLGYHIIPLYPRPFMKRLKDKEDLIGVEIGTYKGDNAKEILKELDIKKLYCIDPYKPYKDIKEYSEDSLKKANGKAKNLSDKKVVIIEKTSVDAIDLFKDSSLDFVYIDGSHNYIDVKQDLFYYFLIKKGGILAGHDIHVTEVFQAVSEFATELNLKVEIDYPDWIIKVK